MPMFILYEIALIFQFSFAFIVFIFLFFVNAPYGKFSREGWGLRIDSHLAWMIMELPALLIIALCAWYFRSGIGASWVFLIIWEFHYVYRTIVFPAGIRRGRKTFPITMLLSAVFFNIINGFINGYRLFRLHPVDPAWFSRTQFMAGIILFAAGFAIHLDADRRIQSQKPCPGEYIIPKGGLFRWVSCPNYLGEIMQWFGWALLTWSLAGLAFAVFTFANTFPRSIACHRWYRQNFPDYPPKRKAVIPGIV